MKKTITKIFISLFSFIIVTASIGIYANAATGAQGYAVYRNGVSWPWDYWHAAIMDKPSSTYTNPVIHHSGSGYVKYDSWTGFMAGNSFEGVYRPKTYISSQYRDLIAGMARQLKDDQIGYNALYQVYYDTNQAGAVVDPGDVSSIRCDGVVEYVYEYYGYRIYGNDSNWDITLNNFWAREDHSGNAVQPRTQAVDYMTKVQSSVP